MSDKVILAIIYEAAQFFAFYELFCKLKEDKKFCFIIYCPYYLPETEQYKILCTKNNFFYIYDTNSQGGDADILNQIKNLNLSKNHNKYNKSIYGHILRNGFILKNKIR
ncbi:TPA: hypothetical protein JBG57_14540, partial [Legionella pneumophila]|nr:hypothetical protein [Legionella pneumophila]